MYLENHGFTLGEVIESEMLTSEDIKTTNKENHEAILPQKKENVTLEGSTAIVTLSPYAFHMVRIKLQ